MLFNVFLTQDTRDIGVLTFRPKDVVVTHPTSTTGVERGLIQEIVNFFQTGLPPVPSEETLEIFAFMDAAQHSKEQGGRPVALR